MTLRDKFPTMTAKEQAFINSVERLQRSFLEANPFAGHRKSETNYHSTARGEREDDSNATISPLEDQSDTYRKLVSLTKVDSLQTIEDRLL